MNCTESFSALVECGEDLNTVAHSSVRLATAQGERRVRIA
jgi:hypothetical protein